MLNNRSFRAVILTVTILILPKLAAAQVTKQQAERIQAAIPKKTRVKPKRHRRVLIWNTPFMENSPHK